MRDTDREAREPLDSVGSPDAGSPTRQHRSGGAPRLVMLGRQGSGKGTQCIHLAAELGVVHLSTGEVFRQAVRAHTRLGGQVQAFLSAGLLVPDELVAEVVATRLGDHEVHERGFVLDGFPRTTGQARILADLLRPGEIDLAVHLVIPRAVATRRLLARRVCERCGYTTTLTQSHCPACGGGLVRREDDTVPALRTRLGAYVAQTRPLLDWYAARGQLVRVDGNDTSVGVTTTLLSVLSRVLGDRCIHLVAAERTADPLRGHDLPEHLSGFPQQMRLFDPLM
jgi:adenylate kinase